MRLPVLTTIFKQPPLRTVAIEPIARRRLAPRRARSPRPVAAKSGVPAKIERAPRLMAWDVENRHPVGASIQGGGGAGKHDRARGNATRSHALEVMQRNLRKTINPHRNDGGPDADRGVARHLAVLPGARAHTPRQNRGECDGDRAGQADLTPVGMAAEQQIEADMRRLAIDFR